jgi:hypothetical protein
VAGRGFLNLPDFWSEAFVFYKLYGLRSIWNPGFFGQFARGINDSGVVVGVAGKVEGDDFYYTFVYDGTMRQLAGDSNGQAWGINTIGDIVGELYDGNQQNAFLYIASEDQEVDLNKRIPPNSGWLLQVAQTINDNGLIAGWGVYQNSQRQFLLIPSEKDPLWAPLHFDLPMLVVFILFGITGGGGGLGYTAGGHPVPVDPEGFRQLEPAVQDALISLAMDQIAHKIKDPLSRKLTRESILGNLERAAATMKAGLQDQEEK